MNNNKPRDFEIIVSFNLVFFRDLLCYEVYFRVENLRFGIFRVIFLHFLTSIPILFTPKYPIAVRINLRT